MLEALSARTHRVITGLAVAPGRLVAAADEARWQHDPGAALVTRYAESHVTFAKLSRHEIDAYLDSGQWQDVAGAYRIQGLAACHVSALCGSYSNVVGLPLHLVYSILTEQPSA
jgi:septum formation protein